MKPILDNLKSLGGARLAILGGTGLALLVALFVGMRLVMAPDFVELCGGLSPSAANGVVDTLEQAGFDVRLDDAGSTVSVPHCSPMA